MLTLKKVLVVFGTRPEAIKMFPVVNALKARDELEVRVCVTGQHRHLLDQVLEITGIEPDVDLDVMRPGQSLDSLTARLIELLGQAFDAEKPDRVLVHGDTTTAMTATLAAYYRKIPVGHVEAGLRSGNIKHPWPEEVNRKIVGAIADLHFAPTEAAAQALRSEGVPTANIHVTGNSVIDALLLTNAHIAREPWRAASLDALAKRFEGKRIIAVTSHRRENLGEGMSRIALAIAAIAQRSDVAVIFPVHPNPEIRKAVGGILGPIDNVAMIDPLDYPSFVRLLSLCSLVLTDSGGVQEEAPSLGKPVLVMRDTTERPEGISAGTAALVGTDHAQIIREVFRLLDDDTAYEAMAMAHNPFGDGKAGERIAQILADVC